MTLPGGEPPHNETVAGPAAAEHQGEVIVDDDLAPRVRLPADALRCSVRCAGIILLVGLGLLARATVSGIETNVVGASQLADRKLLTGVLGLLGDLAHITLLILPLALAVLLVVRRRPRRLAEAVGAGVIAVVAVTAINALLRLPAATQLRDALTLSVSQPHAAVLDGYLAGLVAYVTVAGLSGRRRWRGAYWAALGFYLLASLANPKGTHVTLLSLLVTLLTGSAIGSGLRYAFGSASDRPTAAQIAAALSAVDAPVTAMRRIRDTRTETRRYAATVLGGAQLDVTVFDRDQQAADALYWLYRRVRLKTQVSRSGPLTVEGAVERRALLTYAVRDAGVATPRLRALIRVGAETAVLANEHHDGSTLAGQDGKSTDGQLRGVWDAVLRLHRHQVTHRNLTADHILFASTGSGPGTDRDGEVMLLDPGEGDVAASNLQLRLDRVQLLTEMALAVGVDRASDLAAEKLSSAELAAMVPLLQPVALHRTTRMKLRRHKDVLPGLRKRMLGTGPVGEAPPVQLERIRPRTLITIVAGVAAAYVLIGQLSKASLGTVLTRADWRWGVLAAFLSAVTYLGATFALTGFVLERLNLARTFLAQLAGSFVTLVTPAAVGGVALNIRYLQKAKVSASDAAASVGVSQAIAFSLHILLLVIFTALTRTVRTSSLRPPGWVWIALATLITVVLVVLAIPAGRRLLRSRLAPALSQVIPRLLDIAQHPAKLATGIGGALLLTAAYISCLDASVRALGGSVALTGVAVVYLAGSAIGSAVPTPGGLGAVEAALSAGLTAAGLPGAKAIGAVLLFRLATFWLPVPVGWIAMNYLQRHDAL
ncbi:MAG TPA: lysylphosphatidylglycerol synthase transmembrane domain-containing protein [Streptosporangiaceae bacterium]|nr:lysylphosphatidylglycerol synthase transmembrane domain-containing protein [Streptosporangiaceae bacterium]